MLRSLIVTTLLGVASPGFTPVALASIENANLGAGGGATFNQQVTAVAAPASVTIAASAAQRVHVYQVSAFCSAGTSNLTVTDGGVTIWSTATTEVGLTSFRWEWATALTGSLNSPMVITLASCGVGNTGTLNVEVDQF